MEHTNTNVPQKQCTKIIFFLQKTYPFRKKMLFPHFLHSLNPKEKANQWLDTERDKTTVSFLFQFQLHYVYVENGGSEHPPNAG